MPRVAILCLGDVGRSPRMQYHADAFTKQPVEDGDEWTVEMLGYEGSPCFPHIVSNPNIDLHLFPSSTTSLTTVSSRAYRLLLAPIKVLSQMYQLARILLFQLHARPDVLLVQNPPSIPTLLLALIAAWVHGAALLIDWHNFGYSLLGLNFGPTSFIVNLAHLYEQAMGQQADGHLCVTSSMQKWMQGRWKIDARVLHDRAQEHFRRLTTSEAHALFTSLMVEQGLMPQLRSQEWMAVDDARAGEASDEYVASLASADAAATPFTYLVDGEACWRPDRPSIVISSTSWTADEDFTILARAIQMHDEEIAQSRSAPADSVESTESTLSKRGAKQQGGAASDSAAAPSRPLPRAVYIITGKGPMRDAFVASIAAMPLRFSSVHTLFVSSAEYPQLLGAADLGISLHYSSSGLDLPMKVVDMFGAGLPVCAVNFQTLADELVEDGVNGRVFGTDPWRSAEMDIQSPLDSATDLASQLRELFTDFDGGAVDQPNTQLGRLRAGAVAWSQVSWLDCWRQSCAPLVTKKYLAYFNECRAHNKRSMQLKVLSVMLITVGAIMMMM